MKNLRKLKTFIESTTDITNSASLISGKVEKSLDIVSDTAAWPLAHDYRTWQLLFRAASDLIQEFR